MSSAYESGLALEKAGINADIENDTEIAYDKKAPRKVTWIKKNQLDSTAALSYGLGVSVVHLALFILCLVIKRPDVEKAQGMHSACLLEAQAYDSIINMFMAMHVITFLATLFREIYNTDVSLLGQILRIVEVLCIPFYFYSVLMATEWLAVILIRDKSIDEATANAQPGDEASCGKNYLCSKCPLKDFMLFRGGSFEFIFI